MSAKDDVVSQSSNFEDLPVSSKIEYFLRGDDEERLFCIFGLREHGKQETANFMLAFMSNKLMIESRKIGSLKKLVENPKLHDLLKIQIIHFLEQNKEVNSVVEDTLFSIVEKCGMVEEKRNTLVHHI